MSDLKELDPIKSKVVNMLKVFNIFYRGKRAESVHESVSNAGNPIVKIIYSIIDDVCNKIVVMDGSSPNRYRQMIRKPFEFFLSIYYNDSAYRDLGDYMLYQLLMDKDEIMPYLEAKHPEHWYYNAWQDTKTETKYKQEMGEIDKGELSGSEQLLVNDINKQRLDNFVNRNKKDYDKHNHW